MRMSTEELYSQYKLCGALWIATTTTVTRGGGDVRDRFVVVVVVVVVVVAEVSAITVFFLIFFSFVQPIRTTATVPDRTRPDTSSSATSACQCIFV